MTAMTTPTISLLYEASWFRDAAIYEVPVRAFADVNGDGISRPQDMGLERLGSAAPNEVRRPFEPCDAKGTAKGYQRRTAI